MKTANYYRVLLVWSFCHFINFVQAEERGSWQSPGNDFSRVEKNEDILKKVSKEIKKKRASADVLRFYGNGQYEKITECQGRTVEYLREYGCFVAVGNFRKDEYDCSGEYTFTPRYTARSFPLAENGADTLHPLYMEGDNYCYLSGIRKIFKFMRSVERYGPLFGEMEHYDFQRVETGDKDLTFQFTTKNSCYPDRTTLCCSGRFVLDRKTYKLKSMSFEYAEYYRCDQPDWSGQFLKEVPFDSRATIEFDYTEKEQCFIKSCVLESVWKNMVMDKWLYEDSPSRREPGENKLIEKEAFFSKTCQDASKKDQIENIPLFLKFMICNPQGEYVPNVFLDLPELLDSGQAFKDLSRYMDIHEQFRKMSKRVYYPDDVLVISPWYTDKDEIRKDEYWENCSKISKLLLIQFFKKQ